jgi:hypothetical protein
MDTEMSAKATVWGSSEIPWGAVPRTGEPDIGRAFMPRLCAYADRDTAKTLGSPGNGVYQREECGSDSPEICRKAKELHRTELLGRGYYVSTAGCDEAAIRKYILGQEDEDKRQGQLEMFKDK